MIDCHCHLNSLELIDNVETLIDKAQKIGVKAFLVSGWDLASSILAVKLSNKYPQVYAAIGIHPCDSLKMGDNDINEIEKLLDNSKVIAIGEIGLDYHWNKDPSDRNLQKKFFIEQINLANKHHLPIVVHSRDANNETLTILKEHHPLQGGIMHCYSGGKGLVLEYIKIGMYISLGGPLTFKNSISPAESLSLIPNNRLLIETDSPYLAPQNVRGTINEPSNICYVCKKIADIKGVSQEKISEITDDNFNRLFHVETKAK